jgi:hypothetical protein
MVLTEGNVNFIFLASAKSTSLFLAQYAFGPSPSAAVLLLRNLGLDDPRNASYTAALVYSEFTTQYAEI